MTWTLVDDEPNINVRAIINPLTETQELEDLINALIKRLPKDYRNDGSALVRPGPRSPGTGAQATEKAPAEARPKVRTISPYFD